MTIGPTPSASGPTPGPRLLRLASVLLGPLWVTTFRDPWREGHLRLEALSRTERQLARAGLVLLALLLGSVLVADLWRGGELLQLVSHQELLFLPIGVLPVTIVGFLLGWSLIAWGALDATPSIRLFVAFLMVASSAQFDLLGTATKASETWMLEHGGGLMRAAFLAAPATLALSAVLYPLVTRRPRLAVPVTATLRAVVVASLVLLYGSMLWIHVDAVRAGYPSLIPTGVDNSIQQVAAFLLPLVYVSAIAVIDFALDVSKSLAAPARRLAARWVRLVLLALLGYKLLTGIVLDLDFWRAELVYQPVALARTVACVLLLALLVVLATRFPASDDYALAKERTMYGSSVVLASSYLLNVVGAGLALLVASRLSSDAGTRFLEKIPFDFLATEGLLVAALVAAGVGVWLMRRSRGGYGDELGSALIVVGLWNVAWLLVPVLHLELGFTLPVVDALVTLGVLVFLLLRWGSLDAGTAVTLLTVVLFSWLVMSRGDYISFVGGLVGLPVILVVVFGVVLTLATGSAFARVGSKRLPVEARPLLFVGYLVLSVVILHWVETTHSAGQDEDALAAFIFLGLPMAAWLLGRRILNRGEDAPLETTGPQPTDPHSSRMDQAAAVLR